MRISGPLKTKLKKSLGNLAGKTASSSFFPAQVLFYELLTIYGPELLGAFI